MLTKGIITSIDYSSNTCIVRIPVFEGAGNRTKIQAEAAICIPPGNYNGYKVNDVVVVGFGENNIDQPIILGKLYLGIQGEQLAGSRSALNIDHLTANSITLSDDATINNKKLSTIVKELSSNSSKTNTPAQEINDGTLTINVNDELLATFSANQSNNTTATITIPEPIYSVDSEQNVTFPANVNAPGGKITGTLETNILNAQTINSTNTSTAVSIATGTNNNSYFQAKKFRGQGNASTYNHAIDFGYAGHDRFDFYEYGGVFNFWANQGSSKIEGDANRVASLQSGKLLERGNTLTYPGKSGTFALTDDIPNIYSTEEKEIGTWIDGKTLYRITLEITDQVEDKKQFSISKELSNSFDTIMIDQNATFQTAEKAISPIFSDQANANFWQCYIDTSSGTPTLLISGYNKFGAVSKHTITLKYTKK